MPTPDTGLGSVFGGADPARDVDTRTSRARIYTPSEADATYAKLDYTPQERALMARERSQRGVKKESLWSKVVKPVAWTFRAYSDNIVIPAAELVTTIVRAIAPGSDTKEQASRRRIVEAWRSGDGFFGKFNDFWNTLEKERKTREGFFPLEKIAGEILFDPLTYVGWGLFARGGKLGGTLLGKALGPAEEAYIKGSQYVTDGIIKGSLKGLRGIPGVQNLFRVNARTIGQAKAVELRNAASMVSPELWIKNPVGGFREWNNLLQIPEELWPKEKWSTDMASMMSNLADVRDWTLGRHRMTFKKNGQEAGFVAVDKGKGVPTALWGLIEAGIDSEPLQTTIAKLGQLTVDMAQSGRAAQIIAERRLHRNAVVKMVTSSMEGMGDKIAHQFQHGFMAKLNRAQAELVLGFHAYQPGNYVEDGIRSFHGGVGVRSMDADYAQLLIGSTRQPVPYSLQRGEATMAGQLVPDTGGLIDGALDGHNIIQKAWRVFTGNGVARSKRIGAEVRNNFFAVKSIDETTKELLPFLEQGGEATRVIRDGIISGVGDLAKLDKKTRTSIQQLLVSTSGTNSATIRQAGTMVARTHLPKSFIDKKLVEFLGDASPAVRKEADALATGAYTAERVAATFERMVDAELEHLAVTEPSNVAGTMKWLLSTISERRLSNPAEMADLLGTAALFVKQSSEIPLMVTRAMIKHSGAKNPAMLRRLWNKSEAAIESIFENIERLEAQKVMASTLQREFASLGDVAAGEVAIKAFNDVFDKLLAARGELRVIRERFFAEGFAGLTPEIVAAYGGSEFHAWNAMHAAKSAVFDDVIATTKVDFSDLSKLAHKLSTVGYGADWEGTLASKSAEWEQLLRRSASDLRFNDVFGEKLRKLEAFKAAIIQEGETGILNEAAQQQVQQLFESVARAVDDLPASTRLEMFNIRERGMKRAIDSYKREFTNYDDTMALDDLMTGIAPFWRYESRAWPTLMRWAVEKPFYGRMFLPGGYFWQATDEGYVPSEVLGLQMSPIRGLVFGRTRRAMRDNYPPEHEGLLGTVEGWRDRVERFGFYAGTWQTGAFESVGKALDGRGIMADLGEDLPAPLQTMLSGLMYGSVGVDKLAAATFGNDWKDLKGFNASSFISMANTVFPSRFKDYYVNVYLADHFGMTRREVDADPSKRWMMLEAEAGIAWRQVISEQSSMVRYRPTGFADMRAVLDKESAAISGLSVEEIQDLRKKGKSVRDVVELSRLDLDKLRSLRQFELVGSVYEPLDTTEKATLQNLVGEYYEEANKLRTTAMEEQSEDDVRLEAGLITGAEWRDAYTSRWTKLSGATDAIKHMARFAGAPLDREARAVFNERFNISSPLRSPTDDVLEAYYEIRPQEDPRTGQIDWGRFWAGREAALDALPPDVRRDVDEYLHSKETPTMKEFKESQKYMRVYWDLKKWLPLWYSSVGYPERANIYTLWKDEYDEVQRQATIARGMGVDLRIVQRMMKRREFKQVERWEREYREMLRLQGASLMAPWSDPRIPLFLRKFYS